MYFLDGGSFCSNESAKFQKNIEKVFTVSFESKETTPCSFKVACMVDIKLFFLWTDFVII